ncbi:hypothetical protein [Terricaulis sp.]|uniref:hypothetical protein n=1 Tax=Terricaulis sp. TaxID=2768686 RepID=UPI0037832D55
MLKQIVAAVALVSITTAAFAQTQDPNASQAQDLTNCAGAVAAYGDLDVLAYPRGASGEWPVVLGSILTRLNREPGVEGMTGRYAASAARSYWAEQPRAAQQTAATQCRARYAE